LPIQGFIGATGDNLSPVESFYLIKSNDSSILFELVPRSNAMQTYTANEAKTRFGEFLDRVQREPVRVMRHDRVAGVMVSAEDYDAMRVFYADRLRKTMDETAAAAARAGLTPEKLDELLADDS
jgi:prevent-host-death family protein